MNKRTFNPIMQVEDDGLFISEVGDWAENKYRLIGEYANLFTKSMRNKWDHLVYIDLFANCGYAKIKSTNRIVKSSTLIALSLPIPFSKYVICEQQIEPLDALKKRIERDFNNSNVEFIHGDSNSEIEQIISKIPKYSPGNKVLTFCFVDPYNINSLKFATILKLSKFYVDFLILLPLIMDAKRNLNTYLKPDSKQIDGFLNDINWRNKFKDKYTEDQFVKFLADEYDNKMSGLNYENNQMKLIKAGHLSLYYLAFYSRHNLGSKFWSEIQKYSDGQQKLF